MRGYLKCGSPTGSSIFGNITVGTSQGTGVWPDICRAHAAALFPDFLANEANRLKLVHATASNRFTLHEQEVDVVSYSNTKTALRMINTQAFFSPIVYYDGGSIAATAASGITNSTTLTSSTGKTVCYGAATTATQVVTLYPNLVPVQKVDNDAAIAAFKNGECDLVATDGSDLVDQGVPAIAGVVFPVVVYSKEPLAPFTFQIDVATLSDIVINGLIAAYENGYTRAQAIGGTASGIYPPEVAVALGLEADFMKTVIAAVGNMDELLKRSLGTNLNRGISDLPSKGGVFYAYP